MKKLVIFGVGLIGGSVALALKKAVHPPQIIGVGRNAAHLQTALDLGVIDTATSNVAQAMQQADLVLLAAPVAQTPSILNAINPYLTANMVVTDAGSTKRDVLRYAEEILGEKKSQFIGGHPIAGAEKSGVTAANAALFINKNVVLTPSASSSAFAIAQTTKLWQACGAHVSQMSALSHDEIFASVSHLPHLLAFALVDDIANHANAAQLFSFAASGFRDFTRIAGSHPEMWRDISLANQPAILEALSSYQASLSSIKRLLENNDGAGLQALFERASAARNAWAATQK